MDQVLVGRTIHEEASIISSSLFNELVEPEPGERNWLMLVL